MKKTFTFARILLFSLLLCGLASCDESDDDIFRELVRYQWVGDLGFSDSYGEPLESGLLFYTNGSGEDEQCYFGDKYIFTTLPFRWKLYGGVLELDYGNHYPLLEITGILFTRDGLEGTLYVDGRYDGPVRLYRY